MRKVKMRYNTEMIVNRYNSGEELEYVFFWGHTIQPGKIKKGCLSQWHNCRFEVDGVVFHTSEQFMMAQKALLFQDEETYEKIMQADNPKDYKALGRLIRNFNQKIWDDNKYQIVLRGNIEKFSQNPELKEFLIGTGDKVLVEASPYDNIWGVKLALDNELILNPNNWAGENLLGFVLMETRDTLRLEK